MASSAGSSGVYFPILCHPCAHCRAGIFLFRFNGSTSDFSAKVLAGRLPRAERSASIASLLTLSSSVVALPSHSAHEISYSGRPPKGSLIALPFAMRQARKSYLIAGAGLELHANLSQVFQMGNLFRSSSQ